MSSQFPQFLNPIRVARIQLERLLIVLDGEFLVAVVHVCFAEAVVGVIRLRVGLHAQLENLDRFPELLHVEQSIAKHNEFILIEVVGGLVGFQFTVLFDCGVYALLLDRFEEHIANRLSVGHGFDPCQHSIERRSGIEFAGRHDRCDSFCIADLVERIGIEQNQIRDLSLFNRAQIVFFSLEARRIQRCRL